LPGALSLGLLIASYAKNNPDFIKNISSDGIKLLVTSGLGLLISLILGAFFDSIRNILEELIFDRLSELKWRFFLDSNPEKAHQFDIYYFAYYTLDINFAIGIVFFFAMQITKGNVFGMLPCFILIILCIALVIVVFDAYYLRKEMRKRLDEYYLREENANMLNNIKEKP
jgi:hypothetical protein